MDFWRDQPSGKLYVHGRICSGLVDDESTEGALIHDAKTQEPLWMPWSRFKERFEHVELRTSQEAWTSGAHWYWMLALMSGMIGCALLGTLITFAWGGIETRGSAWPISGAFIIASILAYRRSSKLAHNFQWDSWARELKPATATPQGD